MGIRVEASAVFDNKDKQVDESLELISRAANDCLARSRYDKSEIELLLQVSNYKDYNLGEPAFATFVQNDLEMNHDKTDSSRPRTLSFDLLNGAMGFFNACQASAAMILSGQVKTAMVVCGNVMVLRVHETSVQPDFQPAGAAMIMEGCEEEGKGFSDFHTRSFSQHHDAYESYLFFENRRFWLRMNRSEDIQGRFIDSICAAVESYRSDKGVCIEDFDLILPPQVSPEFIGGLSSALEVDKEKFMDVTVEGGDLFTASIPACMARALGNGVAASGKKALVISAGSGLQVGLASYRF